MKFGCSFGIFLNSAHLICRSTDISKCFSGSLRLRDNESRLYNRFQLYEERDTDSAPMLLLPALVNTGEMAIHIVLSGYYLCLTFVRYRQTLYYLMNSNVGEIPNKFLLSSYQL